MENESSTAGEAGEGVGVPVSGGVAGNTLVVGVEVGGGSWADTLEVDSVSLESSRAPDTGQGVGVPEGGSSA